MTEIVTPELLTPAPLKLGLNALIHGAAKIGKTWLACTAPAPRLILDAEGGSRFTPQRIVQWDPRRSPPPDMTNYDAALVLVQEFSVLDRAYQWLVAGDHPFRSVITDNVTDVQERCITSIATTRAMEVQDWGTVLRYVTDMLSKLKDLTMHPTNPLDAAIFIAAGAERGKAQTISPWVKGQLAVKLPFMFDLIGYVFGQTDAKTDTLSRWMAVQPVNGFEAGDRTDMISRHYGPYVPIAPQNERKLGTEFAEMVQILNGHTPAGKE